MESETRRQKKGSTLKNKKKDFFYYLYRNDPQTLRDFSNFFKFFQYLFFIFHQKKGSSSDKLPLAGG